MSNEIKELYELEQEFQKKLKGHNIPKPNKKWIPEKQFLKKQLEKKKYKSLKNIDFDTLIQFETDLIKEQERKIKQDLKLVNELYKGAREATSGSGFKRGGSMNPLGGSLTNPNQFVGISYNSPDFSNPSERMAYVRSHRRGVVM